ncbi:hypothetical protein N7532_002907 [Penicillium argentinense]|uniref:Uncharacterized protein n=1 Tax=Penicillium argentinense TaxID=1131581 RepID=A0A9W9G1C6_9EURO|nr:uncharacterized protein N7532_002907 [Penicillium argentinense]KAJ5110262.1 hypothetical protein N7532_002907 [Penicillium argentinense]
MRVGGNSGTHLWWDRGPVFVTQLVVRVISYKLVRDSAAGRHVCPLHFRYGPPVVVLREKLLVGPHRDEFVCTIIGRLDEQSNPIEGSIVATAPNSDRWIGRLGGTNSHKSFFLETKLGAGRIMTTSLVSFSLFVCEGVMPVGNTFRECRILASDQKEHLGRIHMDGEQPVVLFAIIELVVTFKLAEFPQSMFHIHFKPVIEKWYIRPKVFFQSNVHKVFDLESRAHGICRFKIFLHARCRGFRSPGDFGTITGFIVT